MTFRMSQLATHVANVNGETLLNVRRPLPIPSFSQDFRSITLSAPRRLWEVSFDLYGEASYWALLAEWNSLPNPTKYILEYLPIGYVLRYLEPDVLFEYYSKVRQPTISGAGNFELDLA